MGWHDTIVEAEIEPKLMDNHHKNRICGGHHILAMDYCWLLTRRRAEGWTRWTGMDGVGGDKYGVQSTGYGA
jgi:hypothetical protein